MPVAKKTQIGPLTPQQVIFQKRVKAESAVARGRFFKRLIGLIIVLGLAFTFVWGLAICKDNNMAPAMRDGDLVLYDRFSKEFTAEDVVIYEQDGRQYIGRVVAIQGEDVSMDTEGNLFVNNNMKEEPDIFFPTFAKEDGTITYPYHLPPDGYFVLGDYRTGARDSRDFGSISAEDIKGKVIGYYRVRGF